jgi:beta/gamma crystallin
MTMTHTTPRNWRIAGWALLIAATMLGVSPAAQRRDNNSGVTVYADINYAGQSASLRGDTPNMVSAGWNDMISSIRIPDGETWEICQDVDYRSQCQTLSGSVADLRSMGWNDRISSLRRMNGGGNRDRQFGRGRGNNRGNNGDSVIVYANPNFGGQQASLRGDTPNLVPFNLNDKVSSIRIPNGEAWEVCQDVDYANRCQLLTSSVADLRSMGWNDRISSLRRVNESESRGRRSDRWSGNQQSLLFYNRSDYRGTSSQVIGGSPNIGFSAWQGSVQLRGGGAWELCDTSGNCATIDQDVSDMSDLGLNDRITSARVVNNSQYRRNHD